MASWGRHGRRGNPYDNAKAESFMKTLKIEAVYLMAYEAFEEVTADPPRFTNEASKTLRNIRTATPGNLLKLLPEAPLSGAHSKTRAEMPGTCAVTRLARRREMTSSWPCNPPWRTR